MSADRQRRCLLSADTRYSFSFFFFNDTATTEIYPLSLHDALPTLNRSATLSLTAAAWSGWAANAGRRHTMAGSRNLIVTLLFGTSVKWILFRFASRVKRAKLRRVVKVHAALPQNGWHPPGGGTIGEGV